jgi:large subunit ribosomal protein L17
MNHGMKHRKFGRRKEHRASMIMNLVKSLVQHERIFTTLPKAKDLRPVAEKIITLAKRGDLHARRQAVSFMRGDSVVVSKLFDDIANRVKNRNGGYTRILKTGFRQGDAAPMALIELVDR